MEAKPNGRAYSSEISLQDRTERKGCWARYFPYGFWSEWRHLAVLAVPIILTNMCNYMMIPVSIYFLGKMGPTELAAGGLALCIFHVAGLSIMAGLLTASDTLFPQTFGGANKFRLGVQVQRAAVILSLCCLPCWAIYIIVEPILLATKQPPLVAKYTGFYLLGLMPALIILTIDEIAVKYVQTQNKVYPPLVGSVVGNIVNFGSHYLFYHYTQYGFVGSALSQSMAFLAQLFVILVYIHLSKIYKKTWDAIHVELWHDWSTWFKLAIPGMMMLGLEWWVCESGSILAGIRGEQYLAVQTILNNVESMLFCTFPLGFCVSTSIRIGQFLGSNKAEGPITTALVALITIVCLCSINTVLLLVTRSYIPRIFTNDVGIIEMASHCLISIAVFQFVGGVVGVCSGIIRGVGMQRVGAIVCIGCMYLVGGPLGLCLLMLTDLGVSGFWWGLSVGMGAEAIIYIILILRIDWHKMCEKAAQRTEIKFVNEASKEIEIEFEPKIDGGEGISEEIEADFEEVKACNTKLLLTRGTFVIFCFSTIVVALLCRFFLDWQRHFQSYCHHVNGSLIPIDFANRTQIVPSDCQRILP
nr:multidrug and toxin extrusion protein 1 [Hymenolepis microstoma]